MEIIWSYYGVIMELLWSYYGVIRELLGSYQGVIMELLWSYQGVIRELLWSYWGVIGTLVFNSGIVDDAFDVAVQERAGLVNGRVKGVIGWRIDITDVS